MNIKELGQSLIDEILSLSDKLLDRIPQEKRRFFLLILGGLVFFSICLTVVSITIGRRGPADSRAIIVDPGIPPEELFYPREPDFLPPLLLERDPHQPWTVENLELFWKNPKVLNEDKWRETASAAVDKLLDGVP